ncbi:hypothetical protein WY02_09055 [Pseudonocardia sp. AL041005-10]|nr:hypothetical protein WY02_09055 [Pseudonocardia sp. AL041005-10]
MRTSSIRCNRSVVRCGESVAGLMPMTASPQPSSSPSTMDAVTPDGSSVGWLGCSRVAIVPGSPTVERNAVTTGVRRATAIRSCSRISFETAATISGVRPGASAVVSVVGSSRCSRKPPTVIDATGANAARSCESRIRRVTSSSS